MLTAADDSNPDLVIVNGFVRASRVHGTAWTVRCIDSEERTCPNMLVGDGPDYVTAGQFYGVCVRQGGVHYQGKEENESLHLKESAQPPSSQ